MIIKQLNYDEYKGKKYRAEVRSDKFLSIEPEGEGFLEEWNNRYRISNICVFDSGLRSKGAGTALLENILEDADKSGARMAVLETQSYNSKAISFYKKNGFEIIGFDIYAYSNNGPEEHNMRIEMGNLICKYTLGIMAIALEESFNGGYQNLALIVCVE